MLGIFTIVKNQTDRDSVIQIINSVASERCYLQTDRYQPSPYWEALLNKGSHARSGLLLNVVKYNNNVVGFGRLFPDDRWGRTTGNIGIVLLPPYRSKGIGTKLLNLLVVISPYFGFQWLTADILGTNLHSLQLFQNIGFVKSYKHLIELPHLRGPVEEIVLIRNVFGRTNARIPDF